MSAEGGDLTQNAAILLGIPEGEPATGNDEGHPDGDGEPETPDNTETDTAEAPQTFSVKDAAEKLGCEPDELYSRLTVKLSSDSEPMTLGEFKDRAKDLANIDTLKAQAVEQKAQAEREYLQRNRALQAAAERLNIELSEELVAEVQTQFNEYAETQGAKLLEALPEWSDTDTQRKDLDAIESVMRDYGFTEPEAANMVDHRLRLAFHQLAKYKALFEQASKSEVKRSRNQRPKRQRQRSVQGVDKLVADAKAGKVDTNAAVLGLIARGNSDGRN